MLNARMLAEVLLECGDVAVVGANRVRRQIARGEKPSDIPLTRMANPHLGHLSLFGDLDSAQTKTWLRDTAIRETIYVHGKYCEAQWDVRIDRASDWDLLAATRRHASLNCPTWRASRQCQPGVGCQNSITALISGFLRPVRGRIVASQGWCRTS